MGTMVAGSRSVCWNMYGEDRKQFDELETKWKDRTESICKSMVDNTKHLPLDTVKQALAFVCELNDTKAIAILEFRDNIQKMKKGKKKKNNEEIYQTVVQEYFKNSLKMLEFCTDLERFLTLARDSHSYIEHVMQQLEKEKTHEDDDVSYLKKVSEKLDRLSSSAAFINHSTNAEMLLKKIEDLHKQQNDSLEKLKGHIAKVHKKRSRFNTWKKVLGTIFIGTAVAGLICVVVTAAILALPYVAVGIEVIAAAMAAGENWMLSLWKTYDDAFHAERDLITIIHNGTQGANKELDEIKDVIVRFNNQIRTILGTVNGAHEEVFDLGFTVKNIKEKLGKFSEEIKDLEGRTQRCRDEILKSRNDVKAIIQV